MNTSWKYVGAGLVGAVSTIGVMYGIYANMTLPRGKLSAEISVNTMSLPPSRRDTPGFGPNDMSVSDSVASKAGPQRLGFYPSPRGYLEAQVVNDGTREIKQVVLRVPDAVVGCVKRGAADYKCQAENDSYTVGDLRPLDEATLKIWLNSPATIANLGLIRLTHTEGVGHINFTTVETPQTWFARNRERAFVYTMLILVTVQLVVTLLINKRLDRTFSKIRKGPGPE